MTNCPNFSLSTLFLAFIVFKFCTGDATDEPLFKCTIDHCSGPLRDIFCRGSLLEAAWRHGAEFYLNMQIKYSRDEVLANLQNFTKNHPGGYSNETFKLFILENFVDDSAIVTVVPPDWKETVASFRSISDPNYKEFAERLHRRWIKLFRQTFPKDQLNTRNFIDVPHPYVVPGGMFQEYYYWDSYWVIKGLIFSEMFNTTKGMLRNFKYLVETLGYIPNSGRISEADRSQPPFFIQMVEAYLDATGDETILPEILPALEKELLFWENRRSVTIEKNGWQYTLYRYGPHTNCPRPEALIVDVIDANRSNNSKEVSYRNIIATTETGWDFSSRWCKDPKKAAIDTKGQLDTVNIIPVDLNSILCKNFEAMAKYFQKMRNQSKHDYYMKKHQLLAEAIEAVLWDASSGIWSDLDIYRNQTRQGYYASNLSPLWSGCYRRSNKLFDSIRDYLNETQILSYPGGVPTSLINSGQQWDFPNAWPPLVHMIIVGLRETNNTFLVQKAAELASKWVEVNYRGFLISNGSMYEKYNVSSPDGIPGGGGEYVVQEGFGWTNGVILDLLAYYGRTLKYSGPSERASSISTSPIGQPTAAALYIAMLSLLLLNYT